MIIPSRNIHPIRDVYAIVRHLPTILFYALGIMLIALPSSAFGQQKWKSLHSKINDASVKYRVEKIEGHRTLFYEATIKTSLSKDVLKQFLTDFDNHKLFLERTPKSHLIKELTANQWLAYFYFDAPWPVSDSDNIVTFQLEENPKGFVLAGISTPDEYPMEEVKRTQVYEISYIVRQINDKVCEITLSSVVQPEGAVPNFLVKKWFPNGPAKMLDRILKAIKNAN